MVGSFQLSDDVQPTVACDTVGTLIQSVTFRFTSAQFTVAHGALETADVHALVRFLVETIASWQAPADDGRRARGRVVGMHCVKGSRTFSSRSLPTKGDMSGWSR